MLGKATTTWNSPAIYSIDYRHKFFASMMPISNLPRSITLFLLCSPLVVESFWPQEIILPAFLEGKEGCPKTNAVYIYILFASFSHPKIFFKAKQPFGGHYRPHVAPRPCGHCQPCHRFGARWSAQIRSHRRTQGQGCGAAKEWSLGVAGGVEPKSLAQNTFCRGFLIWKMLVIVYINIRINMKKKVGLMKNIIQWHWNPSFKPMSKTPQSDDLLSNFPLGPADPGTTVPTDGRVLRSTGLTLNESSVSGEAMPVEKSIGDQVLSGTVDTWWNFLNRCFFFFFGGGLLYFLFKYVLFCWRFLFFLGGGKPSKPLGVKSHLV